MHFFYAFHPASDGKDVAGFLCPEEAECSSWICREKRKGELPCGSPPFCWWAKRDSNPRPSACKADALNQLRYSPDGPRKKRKSGAKLQQKLTTPKKMAENFHTTPIFPTFAARNRRQDNLLRTTFGAETPESTRCEKPLPPPSNFSFFISPYEEGKKFFREGKISSGERKKLREQIIL